MVVFIKATGKKKKLLERLCHARQIVWQAQGPGAYICHGELEDLLTLTNQW
jgi:hypothetical protein